MTGLTKKLRARNLRISVADVILLAVITRTSMPEVKVYRLGITELYFHISNVVCDISKAVVIST